MSLPAVAIVYNHIPHYRVPIFTALAGSSRYDYTVFYSDGLVEGGIKQDSRIDQFRTRKLRYLKLGKLSWQAGLSFAILRRKYSAVVMLGNPNIVSNWWYAALCRVVGTPAGFWTHGWLREEGGLKRRGRLAFYGLVGFLLLYGHRARAIGLGVGVSPRKLHVIGNSLDYDRQRVVRQELERGDRPLPLGRPYFLYIGRLVPEVQLEQAVAATRALSMRTGLRVPLVLIGDGPSREHLRQAAEKEQVELVFLGAVYDEAEIGGWIFGACAVVAPGKVGLTAIHALAYGTPVITHGDLDRQMPEVEVIVPGVTGDFFDANDIGGLSAAMERWVSSAPNEQRRRAAVEKIEGNYTPAAQVAAIESALDSQLASGGS